jgi:hypothetical protein
MSVHHRMEARDQGLDRVSRLTSWTLAGGLVLSAGFAAVAAHAFAGQRSVPRRTGSVAGVGSSPLAPPQTAPQTVPSGSGQTVPQTVPQYNDNSQPAPVVSGGS